uniref:Fibronectin type-III domain-containing protein n=1 Tax=Globodera pallida TaxID=36090 RepID=A0A183BYJ5_GLOPA
MQYTASISPPARYLVIAWNGFQNSIGSYPSKIVHLQIIPLDEKLKPIPSLYNDNIAAQITKDYKVEELCK